MKRISLVALTATIIILASFPLVSGLLQAATTALTPNGHLLTVDIKTDQYNPSIQGLVVYDQSTSGTTAETILSTWDSIVDKGPAISMDPVEAEPLLVWSRHDGTDFELAMMRRRPGNYWEPYYVLTSNQTQDVEPRVVVDGGEDAHVLWWPSGIGGSVYLRSFDIHNGRALTSAQKPFEGASSKTKTSTSGTGSTDVGGSEDPGTIGGLNVKAASDPCPANPAAVPDHGVILGCGRPAAFQLSACKLLVGTFDISSSTWGLTVVDLSNVSLSRTTVREIVQSQVDSRCQQ